LSALQKLWQVEKAGQTMVQCVQAHDLDS
jgi:hypothetical protein